MTYFNRQGIRLFYEFTKSENSEVKDTLIFINGAGLDLHSWDFIVPYFKRDYHLLRFDIRGHGLSESGEIPPTIDLLSEDLKSLISALSITQFHLIAQGFGGLIALQIGSEHMEGLHTLTLIGVPIHYPKNIGMKEVEKRKNKTNLKDSMLAAGKDIALKACYPPTKEKLDILLHAYEKVSPSVYFELFQTEYLDTATENLTKITLPILLLTGSEDEVYPPEIVQASLNFNPNAKCLTVPDASFMIQLDQPKLVSRWIHQFIKKSKNNNDNKEYRKLLTTVMYSEIRGILQQEEQRNHLEVNLLNGFQVSVNGKKIADGWGKRKAKQILTYLVLHPYVTRDELCDEFWPNVNIEKARNNLRVSLHYIKRLIDGTGNTSIIKADREHVMLQGNISSDLLTYLNEIKEAFETNDSTRKIRLFKTILSKANDTILNGFYDEYFLELRASLEEYWGDMAQYLVNQYKNQNNLEQTSFYSKMALKYGKDIAYE